MFGWIGDRLGRSRTLVLTILTYALFTGGSYFAARWWHLLIFRFLAALGIGGEWAVGAALLSETWPRRWRPWIAAVLQTGVNLGIITAMIVGNVLSNLPCRTVFLVGILPALIVVWIRRAVPEPQEWREARSRQQVAPARHIGPLPRQDPANDGVDDPGLRVFALGPLGFHVLVPPASAESARSGGLDRPGEDPFCQPGHDRGGCRFDGGEFRRRHGCPAVGLSADDRRRMHPLFPRDHGRLQHAAELRKSRLVACAHRDLPGPVRPLHDVPAAALSHALEDHGKGFCYNIGRVAAACATVFFGHSPTWATIG